MSFCLSACPAVCASCAAPALLTPLSPLLRVFATIYPRVRVNLHELHVWLYRCLLLMSHCATSIVLYCHTNNAAGCLYTHSLPPSVLLGILHFWPKASRLQCTFLMALSTDQCSNLCKCYGYRKTTTRPKREIERESERVRDSAQVCTI